jgi:hypothetical protein
VGVHFWNVQLRRVDAGVIGHGDESKMGSSE